jgi:hypothetical protein
MTKSSGPSRSTFARRDSYCCIDFSFPVRTGGASRLTWAPITTIARTVAAASRASRECFDPTSSCSVKV